MDMMQKGQSQRNTRIIRYGELRRVIELGYIQLARAQRETLLERLYIMSHGAKLKCRARVI